MMEFKCLAAAVFCGVLSTALCNDNCATYGSVQTQNEKCSEPLQNGPLAESSAEFLGYVRHNCNTSAQYFSCMSSFIQNCSEETELQAEVNNHMNYCDGSDVKDWAKELASTLDNRNDWDCFMNANMNKYCHAVHENARTSGLIPYSNITKPALEGVQAVKSLKTGMLQCIQQALQESACPAWKQIYVALAISGIGATGDRPIGVYLESDEIQMLMDMVADA